MITEQTTALVRIPAGDSRPAGDQFWQGYVPQTRTYLRGWDNPAALAASLLEGTAPVSHPAWCSPSSCDVWDGGIVTHVADDANPWTVQQVRCDYWEDGAWHQEASDVVPR
ncbi:hypothetical protein [Pseudonocardia adelaidensis]|uniref:Uncharacterized protein n=1 Tax=Pseudonocardia adelaidensis TaxID=648754 RepID=A0ABP9NRC2_9PSEU